jgi:hypothetical protein
MKQKLPEFLEKYDFDQESYDAFLKKQTHSPNIDDFGNLILNSNIEDGRIKSVDKYVMKVPANKKALNDTQVELFMDTKISEFGEVADVESEEGGSMIADFTNEIDEEIKSQLDQENILQTQLGEMSEILDTEIERGVQFQEKSSENFAAARDLIISQRISLGEGNVPSDFNDEFPFLPLTENQERKNDKFPFISN